MRKWHPYKARKIDVLRLIAKRQIVVRDDLVRAFNYSYYGAIFTLWRLGKRGLIESEISPDGKSKNWWLTEKGYSKLDYHGVLRRKRIERIARKREEERRLFIIDGGKIRMAKDRNELGEFAITFTLDEAVKIRDEFRKEGLC